MNDEKRIEDFACWLMSARPNTSKDDVVRRLAERLSTTCRAVAYDFGELLNRSVIRADFKIPLLRFQAAIKLNDEEIQQLIKLLPTLGAGQISVVELSDSEFGKCLVISRRLFIGSESKRKAFIEQLEKTAHLLDPPTEPLND